MPIRKGAQGNHARNYSGKKPNAANPRGNVRKPKDRIGERRYSQ